MACVINVCATFCRKLFVEVKIYKNYVILVKIVFQLFLLLKMILALHAINLY